MLTRTFGIAASCCLLTACFDPESTSADTDPDATGTSAASAATMSTSSDASTSLTSSSTTEPTSTTTTTDSTTMGPDTETGGSTCMESTECDDGEFCIEGVCGPCSAADDADALCAEEQPDTPVCDTDTGLCAACTATSCSGGTPVCDAVAGCVACTEHAQCPDSACHLMGPDAGGCFDVMDVVQISDLTELENELDSMGSGDQRVLVLTAEVFTFSGTPQIVGEVAILGQSGTVFTGGATNLMVVSGGAYLYLSNLEVSNGPFRAFNCGGAGMWVDDTSISGYGVALQASCETHVRRSTMSGSENSDIAIDASAALFVENSSFGPSPGTAINAGDVAIELAYITIADATTSLQCTNSTSGEVRNSIVVGDVGSSIASNCFMSFVDNAVDTPGFGAQVGAHDPLWFVNSANSDFHLTAAGQAAIGTVADWDDGDPPFDIDGDPRPQDGPGFPGVDEP